MTKSLEDIVEKTLAIFDKIPKDHVWVLSFSGGKDSSVLLDITLRYIIRNRGRKVIVVYNDTLLDWKTIKTWSLSVLKSVRDLSRRMNLDVTTKILEPRINESFLEMVFKRRYPAPSSRFRWCTERLKVRPTLRLLRQDINVKRGKIVLLTGVRTSESTDRKWRVKRSTCSPEGPFIMYQGIKAYAPLASWTLKDVWDYIENSEPIWEKPSWKFLIKLYGPRRREESLRFGCILCPLVKEDRSGLRMVSLGAIDFEAYRRLREWVELYKMMSRARPELWRERSEKPRKYRLPYGKLKEEAVEVLRIELCKIVNEYPQVREMLRDQLERIKDLC